MNENIRTVLLALGFALVLSACERMEQYDAGPRGPDFPQTMDSIPLDYGRFVSAVPVNQFVHVLWFERSDNSMTAVRVNVSRGTISQQVVVFPRK